MIVINIVMAGLTFLAILVALFGPTYHDLRKGRKIKYSVFNVISHSLLDLRFLLHPLENKYYPRLRQKLNDSNKKKNYYEKIKKENGREPSEIEYRTQCEKEILVTISLTKLTEIQGYHYLYQDFLLPNTQYLNLEEMIATVDFFNRYRTNLNTLETRMELAKQNFDKKGKHKEPYVSLTLRTLSRLISSLESAARELEDYIEDEYLRQHPKDSIPSREYTSPGEDGRGKIFIKHLFFEFRMVL